MAWHSVVLKIAFITRMLTFTPGCTLGLRRFLTQAGNSAEFPGWIVHLNNTSVHLVNCTFTISLQSVTLLRLSGKRVVPHHPDYSLPSA